MGDSMNEGDLDNIKDQIRKNNKRHKTAKLDQLKVGLAKLYLFKQNEDPVTQSMF